ncbi:helix-turn-helix domain-containing protein [Anaeromyxobacter sp. PSR-1]|uniref:helix-turn-helix domain-containing protein n=1 Tax=Anaeromyxobacter sp. PSR-1 TaxID=1300915 RepID=UPI00351C4DB0
MLGVATSTVYQLCAAGKLRHRRVSNAIRCAPTDVAAFARERIAGNGCERVSTNGELL